MRFKDAILNELKPSSCASAARAKILFVTFASVALLLMSLCATSFGADIRSASIDDLTITVNTTLLTKPERVVLNSPGGYLPLIVDITNRGDDCAVEVRITPASSRNWPGSQNIVRRSRIRRGESARLILPLISPESGVSNNYDGRISLLVNGRRVNLEDYMRRFINATTSTFTYHSGVTRQWTATEIVEGGAGWQELGSEDAVLQIAPSFMPASWIYYDPTAPVFISRETLAGLRPELRSTLTDFVAVGGNMVVTGVSQDSAGDIRRILFGDTEPASMSTDVSGNMTIDSYLLGKIIYEPDPDRLRNAPDPARRMWAARSHPRTFHQSISGWNEDIPGLGRPPVYTFIAVMVLFTIVIGPINYLLLRMKRKMELFLVTVPIIAGITTVFLFAYAIFQEGLGARGSLWSFTLLDEDSRKAVNFGSMTYYAGLTPRGGLNYSPYTSVIPVRPERSSLDTHVIDWTDGQNLSTNWIKARTLVSLRTTTVARAESRRRLAFSRDEEGHPVVVNGLGTDISNLHAQMPDGSTYQLDSLKNGERARLQPDKGSRVEQRYILPSAVRDLISNTDGGVYVCRTADPVFLDEGLENVEREQSGFILAGFFGGGL